MALWTPDQVASLNAYQECGFLHPFTHHCPEHGKVDLLAMEDGWNCPLCAVRSDKVSGPVQTWCHGFMADWSWRGMDPFAGIEPYADSSESPDSE